MGSEHLPLLAMALPVARVGASVGRVVLSLVGIMALAYLGLVVYMYLNQHRYLYFATPDWDGTPADVGLDYEDITLVVGDGGEVSAWYVPAPASEGPETCILFCHGNGGNISHRLSTLATFHELGYSCLIFDYRGYGKSTGTASEKNTYEDATAAWRYLTGERGLAPTSIIVFGRSLGGAVAAELAARESPSLLVLEASFTSVVDMGRGLYPYLPVDLLTRYRYPTVDHVKTVTCPVLVMHSREDATVPFSHGEALYESVPGPKQFIELNGGHNTFQDVMGTTYTERLSRALRELRRDEAER